MYVPIPQTPLLDDRNSSRGSIGRRWQRNQLHTLRWSQNCLASTTVEIQLKKRYLARSTLIQPMSLWNAVRRTTNNHTWQIMWHIKSIMRRNTTELIGPRGMYDLRSWVDRHRTVRHSGYPRNQIVLHLALRLLGPDAHAWPTRFECSPLFSQWWEINNFIYNWEEW